MKSLLMIICVNIFGEIRGMISSTKPSPAGKGKASGYQVTTMTWNTDAFFAKASMAKVEDLRIVESLATVIVDELRQLDPDNKEPDFIVLHLQEVTSCSSKINGFVMGVTTTNVEIDLTKELKRKPSKIHRSLWTFGVQLNVKLKIAFGDDFTCTTIFFFQAIGSVVCSKHPPKAYTASNILTRHFGEKSDGGFFGFKFGFKGGISLRIRLHFDPNAPDLVFVNVHLSSKNLADRRRQFLKLLYETIKNEDAKNKEKSGAPNPRGTIFFYAGDFNARTGSNIVGVGDKKWASDLNDIGQVVKACNLNMVDHVLSFKNMATAFTELDKEDHKLMLGQVSCKHVIEAMRSVDEFEHWFKESQEFLTQIGNTVDPGLANVFYSAIKGAKTDFLPSYCLQKKPYVAYGHLHKGGIVHYTDRIFYSVRHNRKYVDRGKVWVVQPGKQGGNILGFLSDHAGVFATFKITSQQKGNDFQVPKAFNSKKYGSFDAKEMVKQSSKTSPSIAASVYTSELQTLSGITATAAPQMLDLKALAKLPVTLKAAQLENDLAINYRQSLELEDGELEEIVDTNQKLSKSYFAAKPALVNNLLEFEGLDQEDYEEDVGAMIEDDVSDLKFKKETPTTKSSSSKKITPGRILFLEKIR